MSASEEVRMEDLKIDEEFLDAREGFLLEAKVPEDNDGNIFDNSGVTLAASGFRAIGAGAVHPTGAARRDAGADWTPALDAALQLISEIEETDHDA